MPRYRLLVQGDGRRPDGEWFGFYAARRCEAPSEDEAVAVALSAVRADWNGPSAHLGALDNATVVSVWPAPRVALRRIGNAGHTFYADDAEAQREALGLELSVCGAPKDVRRKLSTDLA